VLKPAAVGILVLAACGERATPGAAGEHPPAPSPAAATATPCEPDRQGADVELGARAIAIAAGGNRACAVLEDRTLKCWGNTAPEHIGEGPYSDRAVAPERVRGLSDVVELELHDYGGCARLGSGQLECWGQEPRHDVRQQLARSTVSRTGTLALGLGHTCVAHAGRAWCGGELVPFGDFRGWSPVPGAAGVSQVAAGQGFDCAIVAGGDVACWGNLHNKDDTPIRAVRVPALGKAKALALSDWEACALHPEGDVTCLRADQNEQLVPVAIGNLQDARSIDTDGDTGCAVRTTGAVACWSGVEGTANAHEPSVAVDVPGIRDAVDVARGSGFTCVLRADGHVRCWGANQARQLGVDTLLASDSPQTVCGLDRVRQIVTGVQHACALRDDGDVYCWGANHAGQLGSGTEHSAAPRRIESAPGFVQVVAFQHSTCTLDTAGHVACWGASSTGRAAELALPAGSAAQIALGNSGLCAITSGGTVICNDGPVPGIRGARRIVGGRMMCADVEDDAVRRVVCWKAYFWPPRAIATGYDDGPSATLVGPLDLLSCNGVPCGRTSDQGLVCQYPRTFSDRPTCIQWDPHKLDEAVGASSSHLSCDVTAAGLVTCAGSNTLGQLGTGRFGYLQTPGF
jgi:alpha-tubulin suppressor-like RCC1 family protein